MTTKQNKNHIYFFKKSFIILYLRKRLDFKQLTYTTKGFDYYCVDIIISYICNLR